MYVKFINKTQLEVAPYEKDGVVNYNADSNVEQLLKDGYKLFVIENKPKDDKLYQINYREESDKIVGFWVEMEV